MVRAAALVLVVLGCGTGGAKGGPPANAPFAGTSGYDKVDGTYVITDSNNDLTEPSVVAGSPDGPFAIWMTWNGTEIRRSDLPKLGTDPTLPRPALAATEPWEAGRVAAPSVELGADHQYHMAYEAADGVLALADSADGEHWSQKRMVGSGHRPSLAGGRIYFDSDGEIFVASLDSQPPVAVIKGTSPDVHVRHTTAGRDTWQMFFNCPGTDRISIAICFAGSFDGTYFDSSFAPILQPKEPDELGPSAIVGSIAAVLFFAQQPTGFSFRIGAATAP